MLIEVDHEELSTILGALRYYQEQGLADTPAYRPDGIHDIVTDGDTLLSLNGDDIDDLCERINCAAPPKVLAIVRGGVCQGARSTVEGIEFHVRDYDNEEQKEENFPEGGPSKEEVFDRLEKEDEEAYPHVIY